MVNSKSTKRALLTSALAILMCVAMLIGTTFAWFTDTASTGVNKIQAGNLDIEVEYAKEVLDENGKLTGEITPFKTIQDSTEVFDADAKWEPGRREYVIFRISNKGSLALKYKFNLNVLAQTAGINKDGNTYFLADYLCASAKACADKNVDYGSGYNGSDFLAVWNDLSAAGTTPALAEKPLSSAAFEGTLLAGERQAAAMVVWMPTTVGNEANAISPDKAATVDFGINVFATQYTYESDSFGNDYDKDATYLTYPSNVTTKNFEEATSVAYTDNAGNVTSGSNKPAVAAYVDSNGEVKYTADLNAAIVSGAAVVYCKSDAKIETNSSGARNKDLTGDITIYGNGADFQYTEIAINNTSGTEAPQSKDKNLTVKVYDAKNIKIWGCAPAKGVTQNIVMENCTNVGTSRIGNEGILLYITSAVYNGNNDYSWNADDWGTINVTIKNCHVEKNNTGIYLGVNGSLEVIDSEFVDCVTGIKASFKGNGTRNDRIENCVFTNCGCDTNAASSAAASDQAWLLNDSAAYKYKRSGNGTITLTTKGNTITGTIGNKGNTQIVGDVTVIAE